MTTPTHMRKFKLITTSDSEVTVLTANLSNNHAKIQNEFAKSCHMIKMSKLDRPVAE